MDAYADLMRMQAEFRLNELRREAADQRLAQSVVQGERRSFAAGLRAILRRGWRREGAGATGAVHPMPGLAVIDPDGEPTRRVA